ncbi:MAG: 16S rRNA (adenine(1518)-N(6)/adenine(1519)-N(6))-dimethyltransferase RsmA [archaeon]
MSLLSDLQNQMIRHRFRPNHRLGQNFIIDEAVILRMVEEAELTQKDVVLEIGGGTGFLTEKLLQYCKVVCVEKDQLLCEALRERFSGNKNFTLIEGDFLDAELPKITKIVSLPPFNISSEIMTKICFLEFKMAVVVFQREFVEKIVSEPGFHSRGHLSVLTDLLFGKEVVMHSIYPKAFFPKPVTYSAMMVLRGKKHGFSRKQTERLAAFLKSLFRFKNKNLSNALQNALKESGASLGVKDYKKAMAKVGAKLLEAKTNVLESAELANVFRKIFPE